MRSRIATSIQYLHRGPPPSTRRATPSSVQASTHHHRVAVRRRCGPAHRLPRRSHSVGEDFRGFLQRYAPVHRDIQNFITVFHCENDAGVMYNGDYVYVDGEIFTLRIYGQLILAASCFKYLGVWIGAKGGQSRHMNSRFTATQHAGNMLITGLWRIPSAAHGFIQYL